jgi:hypothetical protein
MKTPLLEKAEIDRFEYSASQMDPSESTAIPDMYPRRPLPL